MSVRALLGLCLGSMMFAAAPVRAEPSPYLGRDNPLQALLPSAAGLAGRARSRQEHELARALGSLPNVLRAEVLIRQPELDLTPLDAPPADCDVLVHLEERGQGPSALEIERVARALLPSFKTGHLQIVRAEPEPVPRAPASLARVGPFVVARESSDPLRATLVVCLGANALLATLLLVRRRAR